MYETNNTTIVKSGGGFGLSLTTMGFITFLVFLILKVTGTWTSITWFWVFFPLWIPIAVGFACIILACIIGLIIALID